MALIYGTLHTSLELMAIPSETVHMSRDSNRHALPPSRELWSAPVQFRGSCRDQAQVCSTFVIHVRGSLRLRQGLKVTGLQLFNAVAGWQSSACAVHSGPRTSCARTVMHTAAATTDPSERMILEVRHRNRYVLCSPMCYYRYSIFSNIVAILRLC